MSAAVASTHGTRRFLSEIRVTARLRHPHILPLLDSGEVEGIPFYVMPYVEERSLRERLERERQLPLAEVVRLIGEIAGALEAAHRLGIVHRDIKPANVLLEKGQAVVADFGIMRALTEGDDGHETTEGVALGTPIYMSPEQATGRDPLDGRSDVYALACLAYEALVGEPPFTGPSAQIVMAKKMSVEPAGPSKIRPGLPRALDPVFLQGLAVSPADRFPTPGAFAAALRKASSAKARAGRPFLGWLMAAGVAFAALGWWGAHHIGRPPVTAADSTLWVVYPFAHGDSVRSFDEVELLGDAIGRWSGVGVVDPLLLRESLRDRESSLDVDQAAELARKLGAGRFVRGSVSRVGDSLRVHGVLYSSVGSPAPLFDDVVRMPAGAPAVEPTLRTLADELLFMGRLPDAGQEPSGTQSRPARLAFLDGQDALGTWDLTRAESAFARAAADDQAFGAAQLWLALTRFWEGSPRSEWTVPVRQAELRSAELSNRQRTMTRALSAQATANLGAACPLWTSLTDEYQDDYAAWYSLAQCRREDRLVVKDPRSPSGWAFRASYQSAIEAYRTAFRLHPAILSAFRGESYEPLIALLKASGNERLAGTSEAPESTRFIADPAWRGDSLAFVPWPARSARGRLTVGATEFQLALRHTREAFRDIASAWVAQAPKSADARVALALSMTLLGDRSGLDTLRAARELAEGPEQRIFVMTLEAWLELMVAAPGEPDGVERARALADTVLEPGNLQAGEPRLMAGLAALTGRAHRAAVLASDPREGVSVFAPALRSWAPALTTYAALGGPVDSLAALERRAWASVRNQLAPDQRPRAVAEWISRAAALAFPTYRFATLDSLQGRGDWLVDAEAALTHGDSAAVRAALVRTESERRAVPPANLTWDSLFPEAWLLFSLGEVRAAAQWLDPTFGALSQTSPHILYTPERAAALVRAMALRARLAQAVGDTATARHWARTVVTLWGSADPFLQPTVSELRAVVRGRGIGPDASRDSIGRR
jgi:hypothetical protein